MTSRIGNPDTESDVALRPILDRFGSFVMIAGAGSGKTTSLVKAMDYVAKTKRPELVRRGQQVACITYTEVAVAELMRDLGHDKLFHISTIHSFLWTLVKPFQMDIRAWVESHNEASLAKLLAEQAGFGSRVQQKKRDSVALDIAECESLRAELSKVRRFTYEAGRDYRSGILGHDDIVKMAPTLILERPLLRTIIAQKYPYFFVDESQDTIEAVVLALTSVDQQESARFCLGFFGDPMQKIYTAGRGAIDLKAGWTEIKKPENFRCPARVLSVINRIRLDADKLQQTPGLRERDGKQCPHEAGTARMFVLPLTEDRAGSVDRVRQYLADQNHDPLWQNNQEGGDVRILVIEHAMAASRLGFAQLHAAFNSRTADAIRAGFREGTAWPITPFQSVLLPLVEAAAAKNDSAVFALLRTHAPALARDSLKGVAKPAELLASLKTAVQQLTDFLKPASATTVHEVLCFARDAQLIRLDERLARALAPVAEIPVGATSQESDVMDQVLPPYFACPVVQLWGYRTYIEKRSPYSTQQGIKGAEFQRVLVIVDDEESSHFLFSYNKFFGVEVPSDTDRKNQAEGKETVHDRTRRLFYVCCSRALKDLAIICYTQDTAGLTARLKESALFPAEDLVSLLPA